MEALKKLLEDISNINKYDTLYKLEQLEECKKALMTYAKFKVGEKVKLTTTPIINDSICPGWLCYKHILVKGSEARIEAVDYYKGNFRYSLSFNGADGVFSFYEKDLAPIQKQYGIYTTDTLVEKIKQLNSDKSDLCEAVIKLSKAICTDGSITAIDELVEHAKVLHQRYDYKQALRQEVYNYLNKDYERLENKWYMRNEVMDIFNKYKVLKESNLNTPSKFFQLSYP